MDRQVFASGVLSSVVNSDFTAPVRRVPRAVSNPSYTAPEYNWMVCETEAQPSSPAETAQRRALEGVASL